MALVKVGEGLYASGLAAAQDAAALRAAGVTHLVNLTRSAGNCADCGAGGAAEEAPEMSSLRMPVFGHKGEPYRDLFQQLAVHAARVFAGAGALLIHGGADAIELRVFVMCAGVLAGPARGMSVADALALVVHAQREALVGREAPVGLAMWHLKPLYEFSVDLERLWRCSLMSHHIYSI